MSSNSPTTNNPATSQPLDSPSGAKNKSANKKWWRRLWKEKEPPTIHLSTHFGNMNQQGRPGPIIGITLEKSVRGEPQALVVATPKILERFRLDGQLSKKVVLPSPITCFYSGRIAGIGRVHLCATQNGKIYFVQAEKMKLMDVTLDSSLKPNMVLATKVHTNSLVARESSVIVDDCDGAVSSHTDMSLPDLSQHPHAYTHTHNDIPEGLDSLTLAESTCDELSALAIKSGFAELIQMVFAGNLRGEIYCWSVPQGKLVTVIYPPDINDMPEHVMVLKPRPTKASFTFDRISMQVFVEEEKADSEEARGELRRASQSSHSLFSPSTQFVGSICVVAQQNQLWIGYGTGIVALYDVVEMKLKFVICTPLREPVNSIEFSHQFDLVLILSGNNYVTLISIVDYSVVRCYATKLLTCETPLSCLKVFEDEPVQSGAKTHNAALLLGCTNGSICVRRLTTKERIEELRCQNHSENAENKSPTHTHAGSIDKIDDAPISPKSGENNSGMLCILIRNFIRETVPLCPLSTIAYDFSLDAAFIGDASGIVTTLYPISFLLRLNPLQAMQNATKHVQAAIPPAAASSSHTPAREIDSSDTTEVDSNYETMNNTVLKKKKDGNEEDAQGTEMNDKNSEGTQLGATGDESSTRRDSADLSKLNNENSEQNGSRGEESDENQSDVISQTSSQKEFTNDEGKNETSDTQHSTTK